MSVFDDTSRPQETSPRPGEDLYGLSVSELDERIATYREEIAKLEAEKAKKQAEAQAAHAIFGGKS